MFKFFKKFSETTSQTTKGLFKNLSAVFSSNKLDDAIINSIENALYSADFGTSVTQEIITNIKNTYKKNKHLSAKEALNLTKQIIIEKLQGPEANIPQKNDSVQVICLIGINGSGKTTTAAKLAQYYINKNYSTILAACDTFRAAANEQIKIWANRLKVDIVSGQNGGDAAAIAYDAYQSARAKKKDFLIVDTAGRLHTKTNLMNELKKITKILRKFDENINIYNWLVLDGNIGTNSLEVAKSFNNEIGLNGIIITKLDGSSRGGIIVSIYRELAIPIVFLGTGETTEDLEEFSIEKYVESIF